MACVNSESNENVNVNASSSEMDSVNNPSSWTTKIRSSSSWKRPSGKMVSARRASHVEANCSSVGAPSKIPPTPAATSKIPPLPGSEGRDKLDLLMELKDELPSKDSERSSLNNPSSSNAKIRSSSIRKRSSGTNMVSSRRASHVEANCSSVADTSEIPPPSSKDRKDLDLLRELKDELLMFKDELPSNDSERYSLNNPSNVDGNVNRASTSEISSKRKTPDRLVLSTHMSGVLDLELPFSMRWKVLVPTSDSETFVEHNFRLQDFDWKLRCKEIKKTVILQLWCESKSFEPFTVTTHVERVCPGRVIPIFSGITYEMRPPGANVFYWMAEWKTIWKHNIQDIERLDSGFQFCRQILFRMVLKGVSQSDKSVQTPLFLNATSCLHSLSEDLAKCLNKASQPDVLLECEGQSTKAHSTVLCMRSSVLASMVHNEARKTPIPNQIVVKIQDMTRDTFHLFLRYIYCGQLDEELTVSSATILYETGVKYAVKSLTRRCSDFLVERLTPESAYDVLVLANNHHDSDFEEDVTAYMVKNKFPLSNDRWSHFCEHQPKLAIKVVNRFCQESKWTGWEVE